MKSKSWCSPGQIVALMLAGWINRHQQAVVAYQREEIWVLREMLGSKRLRFTDQQRRRLAFRAQVGAEVLSAAAPQWPQNRSPSPTSLPHDGQVCMLPPSRSPQDRALSGIRDLGERLPEAGVAAKLGCGTTSPGEID